MRRSMDGYTSAGKFLGSRTFGHTGFTGEMALEVIAFNDLYFFLNGNLGQRIGRILLETNKKIISSTLNFVADLRQKNYHFLQAHHYG